MKRLYKCSFILVFVAGVLTSTSARADRSLSEVIRFHLQKTLGNTTHAPHSAIIDATATTPQGTFGLRIFAAQHRGFRQEVVVGGDTIVALWDGSAAWERHPAYGESFRAITGGKAERLRRAAAMRTLADTANVRSLRLLPSIASSNVDVIETTTTDGWRTLSSIHRETGMLVRSVDISPDSADVTEIEFDDFREVNGVIRPFQYTQGQAGRTNTITISRIQLNVDIDRSMFAGGTAIRYGSPAQRVAAVDSLLRRSGFNGAALVGTADGAVLRAGYGYSNMTTQEVNTPETKFRIASLTKSFTGLAILQLASDGLLDPNDPLSRFRPSYPRGNFILLSHLVWHTSGVPDLVQLPSYWEAATGPCDFDCAISLFEGLPLDFTPGSAWSYSNSGYVLLGYVIERASGTSYRNYLRARILDPIHMNNTDVELDNSIADIGATGYAFVGDTLAVVSEYDMSINSSAGSLYSTVDDLFKWDRALYGTELLDAPGRKVMFTPHLNDYGYGWGIRTDDRLNTRVIFMNGRFGGFVAHISRYPETQTCIILLSNIMDTNLIRISGDLAYILLS